jgi:hypothetical protein
MTKKIILDILAALSPLEAIANAYDRDELADEARKASPYAPEQIELYAGRGGSELLMLSHCLKARDAIRSAQTIDGLTECLAPLVKIADAYDANELDDDARKFYGAHNEHRNHKAHNEIEIVTKACGTPLLSLADCFFAKQALYESCFMSDAA